MRIESVAWKEDDGGRPFVDLTLDGTPAQIYYEQNPPKAGVVILDPYDVWSKQPVITIPADPGIGRGELEVESAVDDPAVVQLWWELHQALETNDFKIGPRPVTKAMTTVDNTVSLEIVPERQQTTERLRNLIYASFESIGKSLTPSVLQPVLDEYVATPNDAQHPIDIWMTLLRKQLGWFALPDISTELTKIFTDIYAESVITVLRRFIDLAFSSNEAQSLEMPKVTVTPDLNLLASHAEEVLDVIDEGTLYFMARILSEHPNTGAEEILPMIVQSLFLPHDELGLCDVRVMNINNHENSWVQERCALDLLATLGATEKVWNLVGEQHSAHCLANARRGPVTLDALYSTDLAEEVLHPPASATCSCQLIPGASDLAILAKRLAVTKSSVVPDKAAIWIDVPEDVAGNLGHSDMGIRLISTDGISIVELNDALNKLAHMVQPFGAILSGEIGVFGGDDVAWVLVTPKFVHVRNTLLTLLGIDTTGVDYHPCIHLGAAGTTGAEFITEFGQWIVFGLRLCVELNGKEECKLYPFLKPVESR